jgi:nucleotide-binding universal stress UspA family protein
VDDASLHPLSVIAIPSLGADVWSDTQTDRLEESAEAILEEASSFASEAGVKPASAVVEYAPSIHKAILEFIEKHDIDLVVVGTHGRTGIDRYLLGSVTEYLIRTSPIPVLTVREREDQP